MSGEAGGHPYRTETGRIDYRPGMLQAGDSLYAPRGLVHATSGNVSDTDPASLLAALVVPSGHDAAV